MSSIKGILFKISRVGLTIFGAAIFSNFSVSAQLAGIYTVNSQGNGTNNYTSLQTVFTALANSGVSGPVTINVAPRGMLFVISGNRASLRRNLPDTDWLSK